MLPSSELKPAAGAIHEECPETLNKKTLSDTAEKSHINDIGAQYAAAADDIDFSPAAQKKYLRRVDMILMPILFITYGIQYVDKSILNSAAQFGILTDLGLEKVEIVDGVKTVSLQRFSYAVMTYYWGYFVGVMPAAYLSQRLSLSKFVGTSVVLWAMITMSTAAVKSYHGLLVNRFFLGVCESPPAPIFSLVTAMWYTRQEQPLRVAIWYSASGLGSLLSGIAFYGIGHIHGSLHPWKYQYLILGSVTVIWGVVVAIFLPDNPTKARFLSEDEKILAAKRLRASQTGMENDRFKLYQFKEALLDIKTWILVLATFCITLVNGAVSGFGSIIIRGFGFSPFHSVLLTGSVGASIFVALLFFGILVLHFKDQRINVFFFSILLVIAGCVMVWKSNWHNLGIPLGGFYLLGFFATGYVMILSLMSANTAGHTKKATVSGLVWASAVVSNAVGPLLVMTQETAQHFPSLVIPLVSLLAFSIAMIVGLRIYMTLQNRARDAKGVVTEGALSQTAFADLTDRENPNFRYSF